MKKVLPLLFPAVLLASDVPCASACPVPPLEQLVGFVDYVVQVRLVGVRDVKEVRVTEYEVTRVFKGEPPARFITITRAWEAEKEEDADVPQPTGSEIVFLTSADPEVTAPWSAWSDVAAAASGRPVLAAIHHEPLLLWRDVIGVEDPETEARMNLLLSALNPDAPPARGVVPLDIYLDALAAAVETAAQQPPAPTEPTPDVEPPPATR